MNNLHLFELINAPPGVDPWHLAVAIAVARWSIDLVPIALIFAWVRGDHTARRELLQVLLAVGLALGLAQVVTHVWPQPRPFALHLGTQYLDHSSDPGLPSDHVTVFWSLALAMLPTRRFALWGFPLLALGLLVGWSRVYLGVHFPLDVLAALPVAWAGTAAASALRRPLMPAFARVLYLYDRLANRWRGRTGAGHKT
jgi:undecaprenyl-diphosphatase